MSYPYDRTMVALQTVLFSFAERSQTMFFMRRDVYRLLSDYWPTAPCESDSFPRLYGGKNSPPAA
ncbi:hypothetical protein [Geobacillus sp. FSL K6-3411]|uniref:hypothetical protein n=1 Tax=Geobacillus sp. FSL K6-3411 TaxID=2954614 RepID=UPI0030D98F8A